MTRPILALAGVVELLLRFVVVLVALIPLVIGGDDVGDLDELLHPYAWRVLAGRS